jgi:peptidoglycan/LPS O-acetylase OafA/YrhL
MKLIHNNNFEIIRLSLATLVIVLHGYDLCGVAYYDFLSVHTDGQITMNYIIIRGFVVMSGYLVLKSLQRSTSVKQYLWRRFLRIYPPLLVALLVCSLVMGACLTTLSLKAYYSHIDTWRYMVFSLRIFMVQRTDCLPGVFTNNPTNCSVNGSLWTIWVEELLYLLLVGVFFIRNKKKILHITLVTAWVGLITIYFLVFKKDDSQVIPLSKGIGLDYFVDLLIYFFSGCLMTLFQWKNNRNNRLIVLAVILLAVITSHFHVYRIAGYILYPAFIVAFGSDCWKPLLTLFRWGNPSYGIYIYGYPLQQAIIQLISHTPWVVNIWSVPLAFIIGYTSWHLIEKPFLAFKERVK